MSRALAVLLAVAGVTCALLAVWVDPWWVVPVPFLAAGTAAAWLRMTPEAYLDALDDSPPLQF